MTSDAVDRAAPTADGLTKIVLLANGLNEIRRSAIVVGMDDEATFRLVREVIVALAAACDVALATGDAVVAASNAH